MPGATVEVVERGAGQLTDVEGGFTFENLPEGVYTLRIRHVSYDTELVTVEHPADSPLIIPLTEQVLESESLIVTGSPLGRRTRYQPAQAMNAEMIQQKAAPSLGEILDGQAGVTTRSYGSAPARPVIRGFDGDRVLVMQNGERMGDLSATAVDHAVALDPLSMDRVEVVRGPASLLYGSSAIGGVVNMFSYDMPQEWDAGTRGNVATHLATMNRMGAGLIQAQHGDDRMAATGRLIYRHGGDIRTPEGRLPDTALDNISYGAGYGYRSGSFETGLALSGMDYTYGLPEAVDDPLESIEIRMNRVNLQSISSWQIGRFIDQAELRLHYSDYGHDEVAATRVPARAGWMEANDITFDQQMVSSSLVLQHRLVGAMEGAVGLSYNRSAIRVGGDEALTPDADGYFLAGYLYEELSLGRRLSLLTGARAELQGVRVKTNERFPDASQFEDRTDLIFSGALGLNYRLTDLFNAGFQMARAYRTPAIEELYSMAAHMAAGSYDIGNPDLKSEISYGSDIFFDYRSDRFSGELSLFVNRIDNYVDFAPTGEVHAPSGLPVFEYRSKDALLYGFELQGDLRLNRQLSAGLGVDAVYGRERGGDQRYLAFMPPFRVRLNLMWESGPIHLGPRVTLVNRQDRVAPNEKQTDGYLLAGFDGGYRIGSGWQLALRLDNLFNEPYRDHLSRVENRNAPMPGRNLNIMLRHDF